MAKPSKGALTAIAEVGRLLSKYPNPRDVRRAPTLERTGSPLREASPELYGFLGGAAGTAPDDFEGSVMDPLSARVKAGANYGYPLGLAAEALPGAALLAKFGAKVAPVATRNAMAPAQLGKQAGVIKAPGGNWLSGSVEDALKGLKSTRVPGTLDEFAQRAGMTRPELEALSAPQRKEIGERLHPEMTALNSFVDKQLTRYVKNDMATERDPIRALAERGVLHYAPQETTAGERLRAMRKAQGFPESGMAGASDLAQTWETNSDSALDSPWDVASLKAPQGARFRAANPWIEKLPDETLVRGIAGGTSENLGFPHLMDELRNATNPNSGLPAHLLLDPKSLDRVSVPQAVERVAAINEWRAQQSALAKAAAAEGIPVKKEYQEGFKWLSIPDTEADEKALKYAVDVGCEGGWCTQGPDTAKRYGGGEGGRLHVLVDKSGKAHVQIHETPAAIPSFSLSAKDEKKLAQELRSINPALERQWLGSSDDREAASFLKDNAPSLYKQYFEGDPKITEIKGKGNKKPNDEYLPFVQDFVKSGQWSDVGDFNNTDLLKLSDYEGRMHPELMKRAREQFGNYATQAEMEALHAPKPDTPMPGYARGGSVKSTDKEVDRLLAKHPNPRDVRRAPTLERTSSPLRDASPELYGFLGGAMGTAPDEFEGSVLDPLSARVKSGAEYGFPIGTALNVAPLVPAALKGTVGALTRVANAGSGPLAGSLAAQRGVIKAPGGNWLSGSVEDALRGLKGKFEGYEINNENFTPEDLVAHINAGGRDFKPEIALNSFVDKQLTRYVKNDMATERDPIRALAERGVLHVDPAQVGIDRYRAPAIRREAFTEALGSSDVAKAWEDAADVSLLRNSAETLANSPSMKSKNPWLEKVDPETDVFRARESTADGLGFNHLMDELRNATNPNSGLPQHLLLDPKSLDRVSVPQAVERVAAINEWRAAQKAEANAALANNAATVLHKEYPDKGFKWVELKTPARDDAALEKAAREAGIEPGSPEFEGFAPSRYKQDSRRELESALQYEGDTMGSCVGGRCDAVASGASRIYSLRDAKGQPHVTLEVVPGRLSGKNSLEEWAARYEETHGQGSSEAYLADHPEIGQAFVPRINEIKGKGNKKPNDEYLPFVQDFVKSGQWSDVRDLQNTGLVKYEGSYRSPSEFQYHNEDTGAWEGLLDFAKARFPDRPGDQHNFVTGAMQGKFVRPTPPGYATGGTVTAPAASSPQSWQALYRKNNATEQPVSDQNKITQTKDQFLAKYADALDANGRFVPGKANLWFDGENASDVYDKLIGKQTVQTPYGNRSEGIFKEESFFNPEVNMDWIEDPRAGGGWAGMKGAVLPGLAATGVILSAGALAGAGAGSGLASAAPAAATSTGGSASGLAGALGMNSGMGATALNSGALNAGMTALRGGNIGQVLKSGVTGAVLSPIASYGSELVGGGPMGSVFGNSLQGGASSLLGGGDLITGLRDGAVNGLVRTAGDWAGAEAKDFTGSDFAGKAANSLTQTALKGKDISSTLDQLATQYASGQLTDLSGMDPKMAAIVVNLARNKKSAAIGIATGALTQAAQRAVGSKKLSDLAVGS